MKLKFLSRIAKGIEGMSIAIKEMWVKCMPAAFLQSCSCVCPRMARAGHHIRRWDILLLQIVINGMSRQTSHHRLKSPLYRTMVQYGNRQIGGGGQIGAFTPDSSLQKTCTADACSGSKLPVDAPACNALTIQLCTSELDDRP